MASENQSAATSEPVYRGIARVLVQDVVNALDRLESADSPGHRRETIRTVFAAVEGVVWIYREHVRKSLEALGALTPLIDSALREQSYMVTERGVIVEQTRFVPLPTMVRLTTKVATIICPNYEADFSHVGWSNLKAAIAIRNRITHPKSLQGLEVSSEDVGLAQSGFFWLLALVIEVMEITNDAVTAHYEGAQKVLALLRDGDPETVAEYQKAMERLRAG